MSRKKKDKEPLLNPEEGVQQFPACDQSVFSEEAALAPIPSTSNQSPEFASHDSEQNQKVRKPISHFCQPRFLIGVESGVP